MTRRSPGSAHSWDGLRTAAVAAELGCHLQTVRERLARPNVEEPGDSPGAGRKRRLTGAAHGLMLALDRAIPPGQLMPRRECPPVAERDVAVERSPQRRSIGSSVPTITGPAGANAATSRPTVPG